MWSDRNKDFRYLIQTTDCEPVLYCTDLETVRVALNMSGKIDRKLERTGIYYELVDREEKTIIVL